MKVITSATLRIGYAENYPWIVEFTETDIETDQTENYQEGFGALAYAKDFMHTVVQETGCTPFGKGAQ